ncbi:trigger factor [Desulforhopalus singaporensis]|uniref:Trigger factor n=1 Tax=Desulforhopalus singaporensis TaxID=91360 RepID=A0A1H0PZH7_9BACT|nr:trigger factor [Desulforhopalus singaporensis]SDP10464.1 trigger factor [Desulforhopalus singaporensis]
MDIKVEEISALTKKITVTLPNETVQPKLDKAYEKLKKEVKLKGFRRGKVPRSIIVKHYKPQVEGETGEKLVQDNYFDAVEKEGIDPVTHPEIKEVNYNEDGSFTFVAEVDIRPEFDLGQYAGLEIEKDDILVTDEEIQLELESMQKRMAPLASAGDRPVQAEDIVVVDFQGYHEGNAMPQVKQDDYSVEVGSGNMGHEFEEKLVGMNKGEEKSHEVDFPENHPNPILKGKKIEFKVIVKDIKERVLAEIDDEFAKDAGEEFNTLDELKASINERLTKQREQREEGATTDRIMQKLLEIHEFEVPNRLVAFEIEQMIKQTEQQFEQAGMSLEAAGLSRETLAEQNAEVAAKRVRGDFILKKIAEKEEIKVQDEDMERGFQRIGDMYNMPVAQVKEFFKNRDDLLPFMNELLNEKILAFLREKSVFVKPAKETEEKQQEEKEEVAESADNADTSES